MIPNSFVQDLVARADIVEVVGKYVQLKRGGANFMGLCPFHKEKSPSFTVTPAKQFYHCFGCGANGDALSFIREYQGLDFVDAVKLLADQFGLKVPEEVRSPQQIEQEIIEKDERTRLLDTLETANSFYKTRLKEDERAKSYLKSRGLSGQIAARYSLGYAPLGWQNLERAFPNYGDPALVETGLVVQKESPDGNAKRYDCLRDRITFPIRNQRGEVIGFGGRVLDVGEPKYLNSPETPVFSKGEELYGLYEGQKAIRAAKRVLVVEGYMDVIALAQHDIGYAVATLGTACTEAHVKKLFRASDEVIFSFDGDAAGQRAAKRALEAALSYAQDTRQVKFLFLPEKHDPDSYVREHGTDGFERALHAARPLSRFLLETAAAGLSLQSAEGRARLVAQAKPMILKLPYEGALRMQVLAELAAHARLTERDIKRMVYGKAEAGAQDSPKRSNFTSSGASGRWKGASPVLSTPRRAAFTESQRALISLLACPQVWLELSEQQKAWLASGSHADRASASLYAWFSNLDDPSMALAMAEHADLPLECRRYLDQARLEAAETSAADALQAITKLEIQALKAELLDLVEQGLLSQQAQQSYRSLQERLKALQLPPPQAPSN